MSEPRGTSGACGFCGKTMTAGGMARHLTACKGRDEALEIARTRLGSREEWVHLKVQDGYWGQDYWLHLEVRAAAPLAELDHYLRAIWLECCGHMSQFVVGHPWRGTEVSSREKVGDAFRRAEELTHVYDFGTSSITKIRAVDRRTGGALDDHAIVLMARNDMPEAACAECGKPADRLCMECLYEHDESGLLCDDHVGSHPHEDYGPPVPVVNSPRLGMCGYTGPANPPY